jgi:hypothetical protein
MTVAECARALGHYLGAAMLIALASIAVAYVIYRIVAPYAAVLIIAYGYAHLSSTPQPESHPC